MYFSHFSCELNFQTLTKSNHLTIYLHCYCLLPCLSVSLFVYSSAPPGWGIEKAEGVSVADRRRGERAERRPWDFFGDCAIFVSRILRRACPPICRESAQHRCSGEIAQGGPAILTRATQTLDPLWSHRYFPTLLFCNKQHMKGIIVDAKC